MKRAAFFDLPADKFPFTVKVYGPASDTEPIWQSDFTAGCAVEVPDWGELTGKIRIVIHWPDGTEHQL